MNSFGYLLVAPLGRRPGGDAVAGRAMVETGKAVWKRNYLTQLGSGQNVSSVEVMNVF